MPDMFNLRISNVPFTLHRGLRMAAARRGVSIREFVLSALYPELNRELTGYPREFWQPMSYQDLRQQWAATKDRRSAAARKAVMARWHPESRIAG